VLLKVLLSRKTTRKVRAVEVPFGGSKRKNSSGAPKWAIHVETLVNDLLKLMKHTFHVLGSTLSDLKGDRGSNFCGSGMAGTLVFLFVASRQRQGSQLWEGGGKIVIEVFNGPISSLVSVHPAPSGAKGYERSV
jgi:hypothetical protein